MPEWQWAVGDDFLAENYTDGACICRRN